MALLILNGRKSSLLSLFFSYLIVVLLINNMSFSIANLMIIQCLWFCMFSVHLGVNLQRQNSDRVVENLTFLYHNRKLLIRIMRFELHLHVLVSLVMYLCVCSYIE